MNEPRYMTIDEAAALLCRPKQTLYNWRTRGEGPPARKIGRCLLYTRAEVIAWVDGHEPKGDTAA